MWFTTAFDTNENKLVVLIGEHFLKKNIVTLAYVLFNVFNSLKFKGNIGASKGIP